MTTHTPGPWTAEPMPDDPEFFAVWHDANGSGCTLAENIGEEANARLIAAAPDGLALAEAVAEHFKDTDAPLGKQARAFIAKARG